MAKIKKIKLPTASTPYDIFDSGAVRYDEIISLTTDQKSLARENIGAGTSSLQLGTTSTTAAAGDHSHDDKYYTEAEINSKMITQASFSDGCFTFKNVSGDEKFTVQIPIYNGEEL